MSPIPILEKMISERLYCGLDMGSHHLKAALINTKNSNAVELLDVVETPLSELRSMNDDNQHRLMEIVSECLSTLSERTGYDFGTVALGVGSEWVNVRETQTAIPIAQRGKKVISQGDLKRITQHSQLLGTRVDEDLLHDFPLYYLIDDQHKTFEPEGKYARKLEVHSIQVTCAKDKIQHFITAIEESGYEVENVFYSNYVASENILTEKHRYKGCALIDIGSKYTSLITFRNGRLRTLDHIKMGGEQITKAIAQYFDISMASAEQIKTHYVAAQDCHEEKEDLLIPHGDHFEAVVKADITKALQKPIRSLVKAIRDRINRRGGVNGLREGIVLTSSTLTEFNLRVMSFDVG
jgi:cell division protein FtsA